ncbi:MULTISPECIES: O-methyltransferase [Halobacterium]|uniref:O-methyltransferase n=1 Tax=Halobacterium TaxID=2239 RepID=UPI00073EEDC6|nr:MULTISPECIES: O-methyltransferase [Halobacterium]MCG1002720.1 O-methyltransferase [Halobacterium noricense]
MNDVLSDTLDAFLDAANPQPTELLAEMTEYGREQNFPIVGPDVGQFFRVVATLADAERVFEFGSGFGYSAAWFRTALPADGDIVLTDYDESNLATAREFLDRQDGATAHYEAGDAMETFQRYDGPFDVVLLDHDKPQYVDAFEDAREKLADGGCVVADNVMAGPVEPENVTAALDGAEPVDGHTAAIAAYVEHVRDDPDFETAFVPLGEGISVSVKR